MAERKKGGENVLTAFRLLFYCLSSQKPVLAVPATVCYSVIQSECGGQVHHAVTEKLTVAQVFSRLLNQ